MYILASQSPRRKELLSKVISDFVIIPADINEDIEVDDPFELPTKLSCLKAVEIFKDYPNDTIIAADTIVILNNKILGKPKTRDEAFNMLKELSSNEHYVATGYTIISKDKCITKLVTTKVYFNHLDDDLINEYIDSGSPFDTAGGYGIQDLEFKLVEKIEGSYTNVIGLPIEDLINDLI